MKVGDLVKNGRGDVGIVMILNGNAKFSAYDINLSGPFVIVITPQGKQKIWSTQAMEVISEGRRLGEET